MTNSLGDLLARRNYDEPPEIQIVKNYVKQHLAADVGVAVKDRQIIVRVPNAALAGALRMHVYKLNQLCGLDKRIIIRITPVR